MANNITSNPYVMPITTSTSLCFSQWSTSRE